MVLGSLLKCRDTELGLEVEHSFMAKFGTSPLIVAIVRKGKSRNFLEFAFRAFVTGHELQLKQAEEQLTPMPRYQNIGERHWCQADLTLEVKSDRVRTHSWWWMRNWTNGSVALGIFRMRRLLTYHRGP